MKTKSLIALIICFVSGLIFSIVFEKDIVYDNIFEALVDKVSFAIGFTIIPAVLAYIISLLIKSFSTDKKFPHTVFSIIIYVIIVVSFIGKNSLIN
jgi:hypothetical protein